MINLKKISFLVLFISILSNSIIAQNKVNDPIIVSRLMDSLWLNPTSFISHDAPNWIRLNNHLENVDVLQINQIIHSIFYGEKSFMLNKSSAYEGFIGTLNKDANDSKLKQYHKKIRSGFRNKELYPDNKVVLVEGDSWFEFPLFLKDITDHLEENPNLAIYTHAHASDWISNMISSLQYEYDYVKVKPDVFVISGGGNDFVGDSRLSNFINMNPTPKNTINSEKFKSYVLNKLDQNKKYKPFRKTKNQEFLSEIKPEIDTVLANDIVEGRRYLNKNFYRFLASLKIEYNMLFQSIKKIDPDKFDSVKIITQGYDYAIPSYKKTFGIRMFFDNGEWLKEPLMMNGIVDEHTQQAIVKTIIFEINEMLIELGKEYNNLYHIDSRGFTSFYEIYNNRSEGKYWYDELHPKSKVLKEIASVYSDIIEGKTPANQKVISVTNTFVERTKNK